MQQQGGWAVGGRGRGCAGSEGALTCTPSTVSSSSAAFDHRSGVVAKPTPTMASAIGRPDSDADRSPEQRLL